MLVVRLTTTSQEKFDPISKAKSLPRIALICAIAISMKPFTEPVGSSRAGLLVFHAEVFGHLSGNRVRAVTCVPYPDQLFSFVSCLSESAAYASCIMYAVSGNNSVAWSDPTE